MALYTTNDFKCYRILFVEDGTGSIVINKKRITILPLTLFCLNEMDSVEEVDFEGSKIQLLCFLPAAVNNRLTIDNIKRNEDLTSSDIQDKLFLLPFINKEEVMEEGICLSEDTFRRLKEILIDIKEQLYVQSDSWPCLTRSYLFEILFLNERIIRNHKKFVKEGNNKTKFTIDEVIHYIHNNYMNKITLEELAKRFNTNRTTLSKEFKTVTGETVVDYLIKIRIQVAAGMLRDTYLTVIVIIERVGFSNISHFNRVFQKYTHCLPSEYRKRYSSY